MWADCLQLGHCVVLRSPAKYLLTTLGSWLTPPFWCGFPLLYSLREASCFSRELRWCRKKVDKYNLCIFPWTYGEQYDSPMTKQLCAQTSECPHTTGGRKNMALIILPHMLWPHYPQTQSEEVNWFQLEGSLTACFLGSTTNTSTYSLENQEVYRKVIHGTDLTCQPTVTKHIILLLSSLTLAMLHGSFLRVELFSNNFSVVWQQNESFVLTYLAVIVNNSISIVLFYFVAFVLHMSNSVERKDLLYLKINPWSEPFTRYREPLNHCFAPSYYWNSDSKFWHAKIPLLFPCLLPTCVCVHNDA